MFTGTIIGTGRTYEFKLIELPSQTGVRIINALPAEKKFRKPNSIKTSFDI